MPVYRMTCNVLLYFWADVLIISYVLARHEFIYVTYLECVNETHWLSRSNSVELGWHSNDKFIINLLYWGWGRVRSKSSFFLDFLWFILKTNFLSNVWLALIGLLSLELSDLYWHIWDWQVSQVYFRHNK